MSEKLNSIVSVPYDSMEVETELAILFKVDDEREVWIPKSVIRSNEDGYVSVPEWIVIQNEIEDLVEE